MVKTQSAFTATASLHAFNNPSSAPPMLTSQLIGAAKIPFSSNVLTKFSTNGLLELDLFAMTYTFVIFNCSISYSAVDSKGTPTCTPSMPGGTRRASTWGWASSTQEERRRIIYIY